MKRFVLTLCIALFALPVFAQDNSMPAYLLVKLTDAFDPNNQELLQAGWPASVRGQNQYGGSQVLPKWGQLVITDATVDQIQSAYSVSWLREIDWDVVSSDLPNDTHILNAYVKPELVSASGLNQLTRDQVESYLNRWGATVQGISRNSVTFTAKVFDAIKSEGFWGRDFSMFQWTEKAYDSPTGVHQIEINYTGYTVNIPEVAAIIANRGCVVVSNRPQQSRVTIECSRTNLFSQFKLDVKKKASGEFSLTKFRFPQGVIDAIVAAGGSLEVTKQQVMDYIKSRLTD